MARVAEFFIAVLVLSLASPDAAPAQEATPPTTVGPAWLVVQAFEGATLRPDPAASTTTMTLTDVEAAVLAFTDRPERVVAVVPAPDFVAAVAGEQADPLNAALVASTTDGRDVTVVVELLAAEYDATAGTVTYRVMVLETATPTLADGATPLAASAGEQAFGPGHLFVDAVQVPVHVPVNVCGNTENGTGVLNPAFGNTCVNS